MQPYFFIFQYYDFNYTLKYKMIKPNAVHSRLRVSGIMLWYLFTLNIYDKYVKHLIKECGIDEKIANNYFSFRPWRLC